MERDVSVYSPPMADAARFFDSADGYFMRQMLADYQDWQASEPHLNRIKLFPYQIILIDVAGAVGPFPDGHETQRIFRDTLAQWGHERIKVERVTTFEQANQLISLDPRGCLVFVIQANPDTYHHDIAVELEARHVALVPGSLTAPGHYLSNKTWLYQTLYDINQDYSRVAPYQVIEPAQHTPAELADHIIWTAEQKVSEWGVSHFFIKPIATRPGPLKGRFRLSILDDRFLIPDLSLVSGEERDVFHPFYLDLDPWTTTQIQHLVWLLQFYEKSNLTRMRYLSVDLQHLQRRYDTRTDKETLQAHWKLKRDKVHHYHEHYALSREDAIERLAAAIDTFRQKTGSVYHPLLCQHCQQETATLQLMIRQSEEESIIESAGLRLLPVALLEDGVAILDNFHYSLAEVASQTGYRFFPLNRSFVNSLGGTEVLFNHFDRGLVAMWRMNNFIPEALTGHVPVRARIELSLPDGRVLDMDGDTQPGYAIHSNWEGLCEHSKSWLYDGLRYYAWLNGGLSEPVTTLEI